MSHRSVTIPKRRGIDWKGVGYLTSIVSVLFLGSAAWPKDGAPWWYHPAILIGMATSILGMAFRYKSHLDEQREIREAENKAENKAGRRPERGRPQPARTGQSLVRPKAERV